MKKLILALIATAGFQAHADGFICDTFSGDTTVTVYNHVSPYSGTRTPAKMIVSDPRVQDGRKTIAAFTEANGTLSSLHNEVPGLAFVGKVDLRYRDMARKGEYILGTRLGHVDTLRLDIDFSYGDNLENGELSEATITVLKRNGDVIEVDAVCERYLKG